MVCIPTALEVSSSDLSSIGIFKSCKATEEMSKMYRMMYERNARALVCCVDDGTEEIAGCNMLYIDEGKDNMAEITKQIQSPEILTLFRIVKEAEMYNKTSDRTDKKVLLNGGGLYVNPKFRGCGIATQILKAREYLCKELQISETGAWFSGLGSQRAAQKAGYEVMSEVPYVELGEKTGVEFVDVPEYCKFMVLKVNIISRHLNGAAFRVNNQSRCRPEPTMSNSTKVYSKFEAVKKNGERIKLRIQNLTENLYEEVVEVMLSKYLEKEVFVRAAGIFNNPNAVTETRALYNMFYGRGSPALVCCVDDENGEIVGCNMLYKEENEVKIEDLVKQVKEPETLTLFRIFEVLETHYRAMDQMKNKVFLGDAGLYVNPDFNACEIVRELLKARKSVCEETKISATGSWFTALELQKTAEEAGYRTVSELPYDELGRKSGVVFTDVPKSCKFMMKNIDV
ncbi:hypothetical protein EVAR_59864_1 [Eumeta japonica]|uniref:N-acetyltransferase domain-containing protein n=1 Tax=Eumeta variegata TaxID=151549 RepID=A0A4C1XMN5_EUMVA|nr:hypothetical protein EVAR_59864_1 [Eumeta japonica]